MQPQQSIFYAGTPLNKARVAMVMLHGRGGSAADMLAFAKALPQTDVAFLAPQAPNHTWYPNRFIMPIASNEPWFSASMATIDALLAQIGAAGISATHTLLLGFSQGACLALEYAARRPKRYAGVIGLSGALIENGDQERVYSGSLVGTPVFIGCSDVDFHIPAARVYRSEKIFKTLQADITTRLYPGMGHEINQDELTWVQHHIQSTIDTFLSASAKSTRPS
ncbi:MAG: alpha/beta fold hydrolase [Chloroflexota bacterium]|jgi:predicted esterase|nr:dienelactone hydrolase family protein [Chloroflexota bacterium]